MKQKMRAARLLLIAAVLGVGLTIDTSEGARPRPVTNPAAPSYSKVEIDAQVQDQRNRLARIEQDVRDLRSDLVKQQQEVKQESIRREEEIKLLRKGDDSFSSPKVIPIVISSLALLLSGWVWIEGHARAKHDRATSLAETHEDMSLDIGEAKGFLATPPLAKGTTEYAKVVKVGNFFERVAKAWNQKHADPRLLADHFRADMKDFWKRANTASFPEVTQWTTFKKMAEAM